MNILIKPVKESDLKDIIKLLKRLPNESIDIEPDKMRECMQAKAAFMGKDEKNKLVFFMFGYPIVDEKAQKGIIIGHFYLKANFRNKLFGKKIIEYFYETLFKDRKVFAYIRALDAFQIKGLLRSLGENYYEIDFKRLVRE